MISDKISKIMLGREGVEVTSKEEAVQILQGLHERGVDWDRGSSPLDLLDSVLETLEDSGKIKLTVKSRWMGPFIHNRLIYLEDDEEKGDKTNWKRL